MRIAVSSPKDFFAGVFFVGLGAAVIVVGRNYPVGSADAMGPGYFPRALSLLLIGLGLIIAARGLLIRGEPISRWQLRPVLIVLLSVVLFAVTVQSLGLVIATLLIVCVSALASDEFRWWETIASAVVQAAFVVSVFVYGLGILLPVWPVFVGHW